MNESEITIVKTIRKEHKKFLEEMKSFGNQYLGKNSSVINELCESLDKNAWWVFSAFMNRKKI